MKILQSLLAILIAINCMGQGITISNRTSKEEIKKTDWINLYAGDYEEGEICCTYQQYLGNIIGTTKDSIVFKASRTIMSVNYEDTPSDFEFRWNQDSNINTLAKSDILGLWKFDSEKDQKKLKNRKGLGALLVVTGILTVGNMLLVSNDSESNNYRNLLLAGGIQIGIGIGLSASAKNKIYKFKDTSYPWKFE